MANLEIYRRDDETYTLTFTNSNGTAYDLTDCTVFMTVKRSQEDSDDEAVISKTVTSHTDPTSGITTIALTPTDTDIEEGRYYFDIQLKTSAGEIKTVTKGLFKVTQDITVRTS